MNSEEHQAYMARMGQDFFRIALNVEDVHYVTIEELFTLYGERPFWHAMTRELNETQEFDGANYELRNLTERKVKLLVKRHFGDLLRKTGLGSAVN